MCNETWGFVVFREANIKGVSGMKISPKQTVVIHVVTVE